MNKKRLNKHLLKRLIKLEKALKRKPNDSHLNYEIASIYYFDFRSYIKASPYLKKLNPKDYQAFAQRRSKREIPDIKRYIRQNPKDYHAFHDLGFCYCDLLDFRKAIYYLKKALKIKPNHKPTLDSLGIVYSEMAQIYRKLKKEKKAQKYYSLAQGIYQKLKDKNSLKLNEIFFRTASLYRISPKIKEQFAR